MFPVILHFLPLILRYRARIQSMESEAELIEDETVMLKRRLHQTKSVQSTVYFLDKYETHSR